MRYFKKIEKSPSPWPASGALPPEGPLRGGTEGISYPDPGPGGARHQGAQGFIQ